ncbi:MAG: ABC transporter ATP-binding protein [Pseudomonadota bacterium]|nr:ABC transporter ATP-binding protein [Pseudomonadota bacterium]
MLPPSISPPAVIEVRDLRKAFKHVNAVRGISFDVHRGTTTALLGGNGAGKTTTLSMLLGVLTPTEGSIRILGENMLRFPYRVLPRINFTSPYVDLPKRLTVGENLRVYARLYGVVRPRERVDELAIELELRDLLDRPYGDLSAGQRTRVSLAKALLNHPEVLLLDEPTASLDPDVGDRMRTLLEQYQKRSGCTMLLATHNMGEVERMCNEVIMLRAGLVVDQGSPLSLLERYGRGNMDEVFLDIARDRVSADHGKTANGHAEGIVS